MAEALETLAETKTLVIKQELSKIEVLANLAANAMDWDMLGALGETANKYTSKSMPMQSLFTICFLVNN